MRFSLKVRSALLLSLSLYSFAAMASLNTVRGNIVIENVDCFWYKASLFAAQMIVDYTEGCSGYATFPRVIHEGQSVSLEVPFGTNGACIYRVTGSVSDVPKVGRNQKVTFKNYYGQCRATISNL